METAFQFEEIEGPIGLVTFDIPGEKVNTLSLRVVEQLCGLVDQLAQRTDLQGLLFRSGKPGQFIAGANLHELEAFAYATVEQATVAVEAGHRLFDRISELPFPTVALIDGNCMGGGTELSLAFDERVASDSSATRIAFPETNVGLIPAWGGTQRMPRYIGLHYGIEMVCTGAPIPIDRAIRLGLVFDAVPSDKLNEIGKQRIEALRNGETWLKRRELFQQPLGLTEDQFNFAFAAAEGQLLAKTKGQYPAPMAALKAMKKGLNRPLEEGLRIEREVAREMFGSEISANLIGIFFMNNQLARDSGVATADVKTRSVERVGVIGAGLMGAGIATAHARSGIPSRIVDVDNDRLADGMRRAANVVESRIRIGRATPDDLKLLLGMLSTSTSLELMSDCDLVVEAIVENEDIKKQTYAELAPVLQDGAILASNTSTISITRMAKSVPHPDRFLGMHFFNPVDRMALVEVIRGENTSDETVATVVALAKRIRKTPIVVNDCAGFLVNRILLPYMNEALVLVQEGVPIDVIDKVATKFGMPMGPIALHDLVGLDTVYFAGKVLLEAYSDRAVLAPLLKELVDAGRMGKKSGSGFRKFVGKKSRPSPDPEFDKILQRYVDGKSELTNKQIELRLFLPMLLEATRVLEEEIVREPADIDMGMILGVGFPSFRGGILRWCDTVGADQILNWLEPFEALGPRFLPTQMLLDQAKQGTRFYPRPDPLELNGVA